MKSGALKTNRILTIDIARFYAMALVFYGHFIEELMLLKNPGAAQQYKFIYSFHMVLFIVLSGYIAKERVIEWRVGEFIKRCFFSRLLPFICFTLVMMVPPIFIDGKYFGLALPSIDGYTKGLINTVFGLPSFCVPSWFLLLIIGVEIVHYIAFRYLRASDANILIAAVGFYVVGYLLNLKLDIFNPLKGRTVGWNYFFIHEAITLYGFYLTGIYMRRKRLFTAPVSSKVLIPVAVTAFMAVLLTYRLNTGPFNFSVYDAVVILFASHGHMVLFPLTALAGCVLVLALANMTPAQTTIVWLGQNTLVLMCLNGIFYHLINPPTAKWVSMNLSGSAVTIFGVGSVMTAASLMLCIPLVFVLNRFVPQLVGKPKRNGPLLKNLV